MNPRPLVVSSTLALLLVLPWAAGTGAAHAECGTLENQDNRYDVGPYPALVGVPNGQLAAMDILNVELSRDGAHLVLVGTLASQPPRSDTLDPTYRYWVGFSVRQASGEVQYMDVRAHDYPYNQGALVGPNAFDNPLLGFVPLAWEGGAMTMRIPIAVIEAMYGTTNLQYGAPEFQADGPHAQMGLQAGAMVDYNFWEGDFVALP